VLNLRKLGATIQIIWNFGTPHAACPSSSLRLGGPYLAFKF